MIRFPLTVAALAALPFLVRAQQAAPVSASLDLSKATVAVSPTHYGLMTEEINHSYDGGLYAELVQNRAFKDSPSEPVHWALSKAPGSEGSMALDLGHPLNSALAVVLRVDAASASAKAPLAVCNDGYWGIPVRPLTTYKASFYAMGAPGFHGSLKVAIVGRDGTHYASGEATAVSGTWRQYSADLTTGQVPVTADAVLAVETDGPGTFYLDQVSLFPPTWNHRPNGNRADLMQRLADLHPSFLRFPGGNYLEGDTFLERFDWKKTIGDTASRPGHESPWRYRSSDGLGLLEFLEWCEDLKMQPVLAVFAGYALRHEYVGKGKELDGYVQEAIDEIEYVSGPATSKWGAERARDGHPSPFALRYVEIGNEDWFDRTPTGYETRFAAFYDGIKKVYPDLQLIATAPIKGRAPDVIDEHYYEPVAKMLTMAHKYDSYSRTGPKIFCGEWATREGSPTPNLNAALGDSAWMTGLERNSDIVIMQCYAPLLVDVNPGAMQWKTDLIGFDAVKSYGSPAYYAQMLFSTLRGDRVVPITLSSEDQLYASATISSGTGMVYAKFVNVSGQPRTLQVALPGARSVANSAEVTVLAGGSPSDTNSIDDPERIVPRTSRLPGTGSSFALTLAPYSLTVVSLAAK